MAQIDLLPTLADLAGADLPLDQVEGRSLLPLIEDPDADWEDRFLFTHSGRWKEGLKPDRAKKKKFAVRNQRFRLIGENELYDMQEDPAQTTNVIDDFPEVTEEMLHAYDRFWRKARKAMINEDVGDPDEHPYHVLYNEQAVKGPIPKWKEPSLE